MTPHILVPTDFTNIATHGAELALNLARENFGKVTFLNCSQLHRTQGGYMLGYEYLEESDEVIDTNVRRQMREWVAALDTTSVLVQTHLVEDSFENGVNTFLRNHDVDMIVMGTSGELDFAEYLIGNHTDFVIRHSGCPIVTIKEGAKNDVKIKNILMTTDLVHEDDDAINKIKVFAEKFNAVLHVLYISQGKEKTLEEINLNLELFARRHQLNNYVLHKEISSNVAQSIAETAEWFNIDLIAMLTNSHDGFLNLFKSSVAESVVKKADCPVMLINTHVLSQS
ncbi:MULTISPECIES: universal stress protein [Persicobacter]|uniref:Universal stress protein UspA n=1 Tax=Persicobacter diffluens TaxID=981 RepID=A0AAN5AK34_9BACT|nr:universal stress protein [Persicobacter sp. CCB-QB2]GJM59488.1 universal stress protein UspA [Persicobacter diffluens]